MSNHSPLLRVIASSIRSLSFSLDASASGGRTAADGRGSAVATFPDALTNVPCPSVWHKKKEWQVDDRHHRRAFTH